MKNLTKIITVSSRLEFLVCGSSCSFHVSLCSILVDFRYGAVDCLSGSKLTMKSGQLFLLLLSSSTEYGKLYS